MAKTRVTIVHGRYDTEVLEFDSKDEALESVRASERERHGANFKLENMGFISDRQFGTNYHWILFEDVKFDFDEVPSE